MKLISKGLINTILCDIDEEKLRKSKEPVDGMGLAFQTKSHPYRLTSKITKNPLNDPNLLLVLFERLYP